MEDVLLYHELIQKMRTFFLNRNFIEVPAATSLSILAACENPFSIVTYNLTDENSNDIIFPLQQTGQMELEKMLLANPKLDGVFCITTSYRDEKNPISHRHKKVFKMFEFEAKGDMNDLINLEKELLNYLGFGTPIEVNYEDICSEYGNVPILEDEHEARMWKEKGPVISLQNFPLRTSPFWNMKEGDDGTYNKVDVILYGVETIGSAARSCDKETMKKLFYEISDGGYAGKLFELFGKERVEIELDEFLQYDFFNRFGAGIGISRLIRAYKLLKGL
jgi:aspartyl/asparaginyl-tRNA synthetase